MTMIPAPTSEVLFECEAGLRNAARNYAAAANDDTRKRLRDAARNYAAVANMVDSQAAEGVAPEDRPT
jgi:hypothetical protein